MTQGSRRAFTLLEVLVALAILGLGLTGILSAQAGLFASSSYTERVSIATGLVRCKMSEVELKLLRDGYPIIDSDEEGACCGDDSEEGFVCKWKVETVELPEPPSADDALGGGLGGGDEPGGGLGAVSALAEVGKTNGAVLGDSPDMGDVAKLLTGSGKGSSSEKSGFAAAAMGGTSTLAPIVMNLVYPALKPMLEASIRRVTVAVTWKQGSQDRELTATQFVTNPQQGGFDPNAAAGVGVGGAGAGAPPQPTFK